MRVNTVVNYAVYLAIFLFMGFTPYIGYIRISAIRITLMAFPTIVIAVHLGPKGAIFGGFMFGITSFLSGVMFGSSILALVGMWRWIVVSIISRVCIGLIVSIIVWFLIVKNTNTYVKVLIVTIFVLTLNHLLFLSFYALLSKQTFWIVFTSVSLNLLIEWPLVTILSLATTRILNSVQFQTKGEGF